MANNKRCAWCGRSDDTVESLTVDVVGSLGIKKHRVEVSVHPKHRSELDAYVTRLNNYSLLFILLNVALSFLLLIIALSTLFSRGYYVNIIYSILMIAWGALFIILPFATGLTATTTGIKNSRRLVRTGGVLFILIGILG